MKVSIKTLKGNQFDMEINGTDTVIIPPYSLFFLDTSRSSSRSSPKAQAHA